jgi:hypothetical protein
MTPPGKEFLETTEATQDNSNCLQLDSHGVGQEGKWTGLESWMTTVGGNSGNMQGSAC